MKPNVAVPPGEAPYAKVAASGGSRPGPGGRTARALLAAKLAHPAGEVPEVLVECMNVGCRGFRSRAGAHRPSAEA